MILGDFDDFKAFCPVKEVRRSASDEPVIQCMANGRNRCESDSCLLIYLCDAMDANAEEKQRKEIEKSLEKDYKKLVNEQERQISSLKEEVLGLKENEKYLTDARKEAEKRYFDLMEEKDVSKSKGKVQGKGSK